MSKIGLTVSGIYLLLCVYLITTQGLTGESFIALILGIPWSFGFAFVEYWHADGIVLAALLLLPIALNAYLLYVIGSYIPIGKKNTTLAKAGDVSFVPMAGDGPSHHHDGGSGSIGAGTTSDAGGGDGGSN